MLRGAEKSEKLFVERDWSVEEMIKNQLWNYVPLFQRGIQGDFTNQHPFTRHKKIAEVLLRQPLLFYLIFPG